MFATLKLKHALGKDITVLSGDDSLTLPFTAVGAEGVISVASNLLPKEVVQLVNAALAGDLPKATKLHRKLYPVFKTLFIEPNPVPVKYALVRAGIIRSPLVREPLSELTKASEQTLVAVLKSLRK
jgi:4-hydroxy-tetrahydrodipicolinate synthase